MVSLEEVSFSITDSMQCEVTLESVGGINSLERTLGTSFSKGVANETDVIEEKRKKYGEYMVLVTNIYIVYIYIYIYGSLAVTRSIARSRDRRQFPVQQHDGRDLCLLFYPVRVF